MLFIGLGCGAMVLLSVCCLSGWFLFRSEDAEQQEQTPGETSGSFSAMQFWEEGSRKGELESDGEIWRGGSNVGEITSSYKIWKRGSQIAEIVSDGTIWFGGSSVGSVESDGALWLGGSSVGSIESNGDVWVHGSRKGEVEHYAGTKADRHAVAAYYIFFAEFFNADLD